MYAIRSYYVFESAARVAESGAVMLRGGAYKPRTSPYAFQGMAVITSYSIHYTKLYEWWSWKTRNSGLLTTSNSTSVTAAIASRTFLLVPTGTVLLVTTTL